MIELTKEMIVSDIKKSLDARNTVVAALSILVVPMIFLTFCRNNELDFLGNVCAYGILVVFPIFMSALAFAEIFENKRNAELVRQSGISILKTKVIQLSSGEKKSIVVEFNETKRSLGVCEAAYRILKPGDEVFIVLLKRGTNLLNQMPVYPTNKYVLVADLLDICRL